MNKKKAIKLLRDAAALIITTHEELGLESYNKEFYACFAIDMAFDKDEDDISPLSPDGFALNKYFAGLFKPKKVESGYPWWEASSKYMTDQDARITGLLLAADILESGVDLDLKNL